MTGFVGMEIENVQQVAGQLDQRSVQLRELAHAIDTMVHELQGAWQGHDASAFAGWWQQQHRPALMICVEAIHGLAQSARNNASDQTSASNTSGGGHAASVSGPGHPAPAPGQPGGPVATPDVMKHRDSSEVQAKYDAWATGYWADPDKGQYQCTAWARFRWHELGYDLPDKALGNGWAMAGNVAAVVGEPISTQPSMHAMASYGDGTANGGNHVMIVEEIRGDGAIRVSEMNTDGNWKVASPNEYDDSKWITKHADGLYYRNGHQVRFAALPATH